MSDFDWPGTLSRHDRWLRTVVQARVGERALVDEVMQEVALAAVKQQAPLADANKVAPWLYRVALTQALLCRRRLGRQRRLQARYAETRPRGNEGRSNDPLSWLLVEEERKLVRRAMRRLSRRDAEILLLKYSEDWSYRQLAEHLGISPSAVEARLHRARRRLRSELAALENSDAAELVAGGRQEKQKLEN